MRAMILAAGKGERLRPITDTCPKPLVKAGGKTLIEYHIESLQKAGINEIIINVSHLGEQIQAYLGNGRKWEVSIEYSVEPVIKEVGGGILQALPLLGEDAFIVVNGDIWTNYDFSQLNKPQIGHAHLVLVENPEHNTKGDFALMQDGYLTQDPQFPRLTYSGISVLHPQLFTDCEPGSAFRLRPLLEKAMSLNALTGEYFNGKWTDVGTIARLDALNAELKSSGSV